MKSKLTVEELFSGTCPEFQKQMAIFGQVAGLTTLEVFALWRKYSDECCDQSALVSEFIVWYRVDLGGDATKLRSALIQPFGCPS